MQTESGWWHAFTTWVSEFSPEGQNLISPNLYTTRNVLFANYIFSVSPDEGWRFSGNFGTFRNIEHHLYDFNQSKFYFLICFHHLEKFRRCFDENVIYNSALTMRLYFHSAPQIHIFGTVVRYRLFSTVN